MIEAFLQLHPAARDRILRSGHRGLLSGRGRDRRHYPLAQGMA
jgi:hypothetical protein